MVTLLKMRKYYLSSSQSQPKIRQKKRLKQRKLVASQRSEKAQNQLIQTKHTSNHYFQTLPEPEVSISQDKEIDYSIDYITDFSADGANEDYAIKVASEPPPVQSAPQPSPPAKKSILNHYIDDFFAEAPLDTPTIQKPEFIPYQPRSTVSI